MADNKNGLGDIRAIFFDLDDTLRVSVPHPHDAIVAFLSEQGLELSEETRKSAFRWAHSYWANSTTLLDDHEKHQGYEDPFWQNYTRRNLRSFNLTEEQIEALAPSVHRYMGKGYKPQSQLVPAAIETLTKLRTSGLYVALLTNRSRPIYKEMLELDLDHHLDLFLTAGQIDFFKPASEFFTKPLQMLGLQHSQVVYVGDNLHADILGAQNANITPILIDPRDLYPEHKGIKIQAISELFAVLELEE